MVADKPLEPLVPGKELEYLTENWRRLLNEASASYKTSPTPAVLKSARPTTVEGDVVTVAFTAEVLKEKVEKLENQKVADEIISKFLGRPYHIRCVYQPKSNHLVRAAQSLGAQIVNVEEKWTSEKT